MLWISSHGCVKCWHNVGMVLLMPCCAVLRYVMSCCLFHAVPYHAVLIVAWEPNWVFECCMYVAGKGEGLIITPFAAGHMIGGSIWRISTAVGEDVVYAVDYNHRKELHLNSTALAGLFSRPALMIADANRQAFSTHASLHNANGPHLEMHANTYSDNRRSCGDMHASLAETLGQA